VDLCHYHKMQQNCICVCVRHLWLKSWRKTEFCELVSFGQLAWCQTLLYRWKDGFILKKLPPHRFAHVCCVMIIMFPGMGFSIKQSLRLMYSLLMYQPKAPYKIYVNIKDITPTYSGASVNCNQLPMISYY